MEWVAQARSPLAKLFVVNSGHCAGTALRTGRFLANRLLQEAANDGPPRFRPTGRAARLARRNHRARIGAGRSRSSAGPKAESKPIDPASYLAIFSGNRAPA